MAQVPPIKLDEIPILKMPRQENIKSAEDHNVKTLNSYQPNITLIEQRNKKISQLKGIYEKYLSRRSPQKSGCAADWPGISITAVEH